jgi:hypothetical protein
MIYIYICIYIPCLTCPLDANVCGGRADSDGNECKCAANADGVLGSTDLVERETLAADVTCTKAAEAGCWFYPEYYIGPEMVTLSAEAMETFRDLLERRRLRDHRREEEK